MRSSGLFLHVTSLPGPYGIGDLGAAGRRFADFLRRARQRYWQMLPLGPVGPGASPYSSPSAFAGNPLLISPEPLLERGLLADDDLKPAADFPAGRVDYDRVIPFKEQFLQKAFARFEAQATPDEEEALQRFQQDNAAWLGDYALFMALREAHGGAPWTRWPAPLRRRTASALREARQKHARAIRKHVFRQHLFDRQWTALRDYCHARGVRLFGDLPIYVDHNSADVWAHQDLFRLDKKGQPTVVSGVPPDYFSETGQRWGNPIYRWDVMQQRGFAWWTRRLRAVLGRVDLLRLDHFRGFEAYWEIPAEEETAVNGRWVEGPGAALFEALRDELGAQRDAPQGAPLPVVAEDLGVITPEVRALMRQFDLPGMAVLPFGFEGGPSSEYLPHHYRRRLAAYTSTHDTDTLAGWYASADDEDENNSEAEARAFAAQYLSLESLPRTRSGDGASIHGPALRALMASVAERVVFPMQDVLGLGSAARMNTPGAGGNSWRWRLTAAQFEAADDAWLARLTTMYDRFCEKEGEGERGMMEAQAE